MKTLLKTRHSIDSETLIDYEVFSDAKYCSYEEAEDVDEEYSALTVQADKIDYYYSIASGLLTGLLDIFCVGDWDFVTAKKDANLTVNNIVLNFAKKDPRYIKEYCSKNGKDPDRLDTAIHYLEKKYKLPGDSDYRKLTKRTITHNTHRLDDICHHPTIFGLTCSIIVQFTSETIYVDSNNKLSRLPITVNKYNQFIGANPVSKLFAGILNWFFNVAHIVANTQGHWISDIAGSSTSAKKGNDGSGLPGPILSLIKELSALPIIKSNKMGKTLRKAFQNGIGKRDSQVDLYIFNSLFQGASSKFDLRTEMAIEKEIRRQSVPVILNEVIVRSIYFIRRFIQEYECEKSIKQIDLSKVMPFNNHTIARMITVASGTFVVVDVADAAIRAAIRVGNNKSAADFLSNMVLRVNFPGLGRFFIAVSYDALLSVRRRKLERQKQERSTLQVLNDSHMQFHLDDEWIALDSIDTYSNIRESTTDEICEYIDTYKSDNNSTPKIKHSAISFEVPLTSIAPNLEPKPAAEKKSYLRPILRSIIRFVLNIFALAGCIQLSIYLVNELKKYGISDIKLYLISAGLIFSTIMQAFLTSEDHGIFFGIRILFHLVYLASINGAAYCMCKYLYQADKFRIPLWVPIVCSIVWIITTFIYLVILEDRDINKFTHTITLILRAPIRYITLASLSLFVFRFFAWLFSAMDNPFKGASFCAIAACLFLSFWDCLIEYGLLEDSRN